VKIYIVTGLTLNNHQYPWGEQPKKIDTMFTRVPEDLSMIRARNALKILLDVHGDIGRK
jgi:solute carrier family 25 aspartate/glutamate transporter 12/13